jgi:hypothetical protein
MSAQRVREGFRPTRLSKEKPQRAGGLNRGSGCLCPSRKLAETNVQHPGGAVMSNVVEFPAGGISGQLPASIDLADWQDKDPPARQWVVPDLIPVGCVTLLSGAGGLGKSALALDLMLAIATAGLHKGEAGVWLGRETKAFPPVSVGFFAEDDSDELVRRVKRMARARNLDLERLGSAVKIIPAPDDMDATIWFSAASPAAGATPLFDYLLDVVSTEGASLLVLDCTSAIFSGNEIVRSEVAGFMLALNQVARRYRIAILLLTHPSLEGMKGNGTSGSTAWINQCRSFLRLETPEGAPDELKLTHAKSNWSRKGTSIRLKFDGSEFTVLEVTEATEGGHGRRPARETRLSAGQEVCLQSLKKALDHGGETSPGGEIPTGVRVVKIDLWRRYFDSSTSALTAEARRQGWRRDTQALQSKGVICVASDRAWIPFGGQS